MVVVVVVVVVQSEVSCRPIVFLLGETPSTTV